MHPEVILFGRAFASYGLMAGLGVLLAASLALILGKAHGLTAYRVLLFLLVGCLCGFAGAFLLYVPVSYTPSELIAQIKSGSFEPGFVFYGGLIAGLLGARLLGRKSGWKLEVYEKALVPALPLGHASGRVGCFLAGCCYGRFSDSFLAVRFPALPRAALPVQLFEAAYLVGMCAVLSLMSLKNKKHLLGAYILMYTPVRFGLEFLRGDEIRGALGPLSTSQWISLLLLLCWALYLVKNARKA